MRKHHAVALTLALVAGFAARGQAAPLPVSGVTDLAGNARTDVALGCGPGHTRGHFGACVRLHHRHHRIHGGHSGHDYDIHDRRHYHEDPHLYHGTGHHHGRRHSRN